MKIICLKFNVSQSNYLFDIFRESIFLRSNVQIGLIGDLGIIVKKHLNEDLFIFYFISLLFINKIEIDTIPTV